MKRSGGSIVWDWVLGSVVLGFRVSSQQGRGSGSVTAPSWARVRYFLSSGLGSLGTGATKNINSENWDAGVLVGLELGSECRAIWYQRSWGGRTRTKNPSDVARMAMNMMWKGISVMVLTHWRQTSPKAAIVRVELHVRRTAWGDASDAQREMAST